MNKSNSHSSFPGAPLAFLRPIQSHAILPVYTSFPVGTEGTDGEEAFLDGDKGMALDGEDGGLGEVGDDFLGLDNAVMIFVLKPNDD